VGRHRLALLRRLRLVLLIRLRGLAIGLLRLAVGLSLLWILRRLTVGLLGLTIGLLRLAVGLLRLAIRLTLLKRIVRRLLQGLLRRILRRRRLPLLRRLLLILGIGRLQRLLLRLLLLWLRLRLWLKRYRRNIQNGNSRRLRRRGWSRSRHRLGGRCRCRRNRFCGRWDCCRFHFWRSRRSRGDLFLRRRSRWRLLL